MALQVGLVELKLAQSWQVWKDSVLGETMLAVYTPNMLFESLISGIIRASPALLPHYHPARVFSAAVWYTVQMEHDQGLLPCCAGRSFGFSLAHKYDNGQAIAGEARNRKQKRSAAVLNPGNAFMTCANILEDHCVGKKRPMSSNGLGKAM
ncbi:hypothetical protein HBI84_043590 [Parastagonospora nodorum]|nr:hypothetical protein HBI84_043590 [Parastagonospora nodorum]